MQIQKTIWALWIVCALLRSGICADAAAERAAKAGTLTEIRNHRVLRLFGADATERGFAHGYLLGPDFLSSLEAAVQSLPGFNAERYNAEFLPWAMTQFEWDADANAEFDGIFAGVSARLGAEGLRSKILGRAITRNDFVGMNCLADYFGPACSAFAAWGGRTAGGKVVHARTLDFPIGADAVAAQLLIVCEPLPERGKDAPARKGFVAVGWPGMTAQYSGMNADGLSACIHDGYNVRERGKGKRDSTAGPFFARGLLLRRMLESIDPAAGDAGEAGARMAGAHASACGNLFQFCWPNTAAQKTNTQPSAVVEFDPIDRKAFVRKPDAAGDCLVLTNHFCVLSNPTECARCMAIEKGLGLLEKAKQSVGLPEARKLLMAAEQPVAAHSVYFYPDSLEFHVALSKRNIMSPRVAPTKFMLAELLNGK